MVRHHQRIIFGRRHAENVYATNENPSTIALPARKGPRSGQHQRAQPSNTSHEIINLPGSGDDFERGSYHDSHMGDRNGSRRRAKHNRCNILSYVISAAYLSTASFNYFISRLSSPVEQKQSSRWSDRKKELYQSKMAPSDERAELFLRTGKINGVNREQLVSSSHNSQIRGSRRDRESKQSTLPHQGPSSRINFREWPPLSSLIDATGNIADGANISGLLDFSIIGFPKTGTTSILRHLVDLSNSLPKEHCELVVNDTAKLVRYIYDDHTKRSSLDSRLVGIKCPQDISSDYSMVNYAKYFPRTKLIVGIRHPVLWFESLYNFRVSNVPWKTMLPTSKLTKGCPSGSQGVCAWRANFHDFLARLGKTPLSSPSELKLLSLGLNTVQSKVGPVFLYDLSQLNEDEFRKDLQIFLGLSDDMPPLPKIDTSGRFDHIASAKLRSSTQLIDICNPEHDIIRSVLMEKARRASIWIRSYFLKSKEVFVSNRPSLEVILHTWMRDPCR